MLVSTTRDEAVSLVQRMNRMNRPLHPLIALALAAAMGCLSAYGVLYLHGPETGRVPTPTIALVATASGPLPPPAPPTGAAINPGNSGGALIDTAGRLVGLNVAILSHSGGSEGIGFAIPVDYVQTVASALRTKGRVARAWLGVSTAPAQRGEGALVVLVEPDGPADRAGIAPGDVIVRVDEKPVSHATDVRSVVVGAEPGTHVPIEFVRKGARAAVDVTLLPVPAQQAAR